MGLILRAGAALGTRGDTMAADPVERVRRASGECF